MPSSLTAQQRKQAGELLRSASAALRGLSKEAAQREKADGPVINIGKLKELLKNDRTAS